MSNIFEQNRNMLLNNECYSQNWKMLSPEGGYFIMADITNEIPNIPKKYFYKNAKLGKNGSDEPINQTLD